MLQIRKTAQEEGSFGAAVVRKTTMLTTPLRVNTVTQMSTVEGKGERKYQLSFEQPRKEEEV